MDPSDIQYLLENNLSSIERLLLKVSDDESVRICMKNIRQEVISLKNKKLIQRDKITLIDTYSNTKDLNTTTNYSYSRYGLLKNNDRIKYNETNEMKQHGLMTDSISGHVEHVQYLNNVANSLRTELSQRPSTLSINEQKKLSILENISYVGGLLKEHKNIQDSLIKNTNTVENKSILRINTSFQQQDEYQNYNEMSHSTDEDVIDDRISNDCSNDGLKSEVFCASDGKPIFLNSNDTLEGYWLQGPIFDEDDINSSFNTIIGEGNNNLNYRKYYATENLGSIEDGVEICP